MPAPCGRRCGSPSASRNVRILTPWYGVADHPMRVVFFGYLLLIAAALAYAIDIGLTHH